MGYEEGSARASAINDQIAKTKKRFKMYGQTGVLCGKDGYPHLIADPGFALQYGHTGEILVPTFAFVYFAGIIGYAGGSTSCRSRGTRSQRRARSSSTFQRPSTSWWDPWLGPLRPTPSSETEPSWPPRRTSPSPQGKGGPRGLGCEFSVNSGETQLAVAWQGNSSHNCFMKTKQKIILPQKKKKKKKKKKVLWFNTTV